MGRRRVVDDEENIVAIIQQVYTELSYPSADKLKLTLKSRGIAFLRRRKSIGSRKVTDFDGTELAEKDLAAKYGVRFTPTFQFFPERAGPLKSVPPVKREVARAPGYLRPDDFLEFVHEIDHSPLEPNPAMGDAIAALPGRKLILTNGSVAHAGKVLERLGIGHHFEAVFDIVAAELEPKPAPIRSTSHSAPRSTSTRSNVSPRHCT